MDLVKKKSVAFDLDTYARLSTFAANLRAANPGGGFVSMSAAVAVLLDGWEELRRASSEDVTVITDKVDSGQVSTEFTNKYFPQ